jgi:hypothetical protein
MESINAPIPKLVYEMSRWEDQVTKDGAIIARSKITNKNGISNIEIEIKY